MDSTLSSYLGTTEQGANNDGPEVRKFLRASGVSVRAPWCAAYIAYGALHCGYALPPIPAYTVSWQNFLPHAEQPEPGQLFTLYYRNLGRVGHIGYIEDVGNNSITTLEGNTGGQGSREGDGVYRMKRLRGQVHAYLIMQQMADGEA